MSLIDKIPLLSQAKSLFQAISGDKKGAEETQLRFIHETPVISQISSLVEAIRGNDENARKIQEDFLRNTLEKTPVVSQMISLGLVISGDSEKAKQQQIEFLDGTVNSLTELISGHWINTWKQLSTSAKLTNRQAWMKEFHHQNLHDMIIPGTHDSTTYQFEQVPVASNFAKCQQFSIYDQLKGGIRSLDIRINGTKHFDKIYCSHLFLTVSLQTVLKHVKQFIDENPSEVIVFLVAGDQGDGNLAEAKKQAFASLAGRITDSVIVNGTVGKLAFGGMNIIYMQDGKCENLERDNSWTKTGDISPVKVIDKVIEYARAKNRKVGTMNLMACQSTMSFENFGDAMNTIIPQLPTLGRGIEDLSGYSNYEVLHRFLEDSQAVAGSNIVNLDFANDEIIAKTIALNRI